MLCGHIRYIVVLHLRRSILVATHFWNVNQPTDYCMKTSFNLRGAAGFAFKYQLCSDCQGRWLSGGLHYRALTEPGILGLICQLSLSPILLHNISCLNFQLKQDVQSFSRQQLEDNVVAVVSIALKFVYQTGTG